MPHRDTSTKSIQQALSRAMIKPLKITANLGEMLVKGTIKEYVSTELPGLMGMFETNQELASDVVKTIQNPKDAVTRAIARMKESEGVQAVSTVLKYAVDDLRTGKLYDEHRMRDLSGDLMDDFGDFDMSGFDDMGDWDDSESSESSEAWDIAEEQEKAADQRAEATIDAIGVSTGAIIETEVALHKDNIRNSLKRHTQSMTAMTDLVTVTGAIHQTMNNHLIAIAEMSKTMHEHMMSEVTEIKTILTEIRDHQIPKKEEKKKRESNSPIDESTGALDIRKYAKYVARNAMDVTGIGMVTDLLDPTFIGDIIANNPWQFVTDAIFKKILPDTTKKALSRTDKNIQGFFPSLLNRLAAYGENEYEGIKPILAQIFGFQERSTASIDTSKYNKNKVDFTGKIAKAITDVMPTQLSKIISLLSGEPAKVYDYNTGKFVNAERTFAEYSRRSKDLVGEMWETVAAFDARINNPDLKLTRSGIAEDERKARNEMKDAVHDMLQQAAHQGQFISPNMGDNALSNLLPDSFDPNYRKVLLAILNSFSTDEMMNVNADIQRARRSRYNRSESLTEQLERDGTMAAFNDLLISGGRRRSLESRVLEGRTNVSSMSSEEYKNFTSSINKKYKRFSMPNVLTGILTALNRGIITYSYDVNSDIRYSTGWKEAQEARKKTLEEIGKTERNEAIKRENERKYEEELAEERKKGQSRQEVLVEGSGHQFGITDSMDVMIEAFRNPHMTIQRVFENEEEQKAYERKLRTQERVKGKLKEKLGFFGSIQAMIAKPFGLLETALDKMDKAMFRIVFGEQAEDILAGHENDEEKGIVQALQDILKANINSLGKWFKENVVDNLFGEKGLFPDLKQRITKWFDDKVITKGRELFESAKAKTIGTKDEGGLYQGGPFSNFANNFVGLKSKSKEEVKSSMDGFMQTFKNSLSSILYGSKWKQDHWVDSNGEEHFSDPYFEKGEGGIVGMFKSAGQHLKNFLFGTDENSDSKKLWNDVMDESKKALPGGVAGGIIGGAGTLGAGLITGLWLPGGPIFGALLGTATGFIASSDALKDHIFGHYADPEDKSKGRVGGLIDKEVQEGVKKYLPKLGIGAGIGATAAHFGLLPGAISPMMGGIIGAFGGMIAANDEFRELIFGNKEDDDSGWISKNTRKKMVRALPAGILGMWGAGKLMGAIGQMGLVPALIAAPAGPLVTGIGALAGIFAAPKLEKFFFGERDENGNLIEGKEGVFGKIFRFTKNELFDPFFKRVNEMGHGIAKWFGDQIMKPLKTAMDPVKRAFKEGGGIIVRSFKLFGNILKGAVDRVFDSAFGKPLSEIAAGVAKKGRQLVNFIVTGIGKTLGGIIASPFMLLGALGNHLDKKQTKRREQRRARWRRDHPNGTEEEFRQWERENGYGWEQIVGDAVDRTNNPRTGTQDNPEVDEVSEEEANRRAEERRKAAEENRAAAAENFGVSERAQEAADRARQPNSAETRTATGIERLVNLVTDIRGTVRHDSQQAAEDRNFFNELRDAENETVEQTSLFGDEQGHGRGLRRLGRGRFRRFGRGNPAVEASRMSYLGGFRASDGGTHPGFFTSYGASKGISMTQGSTDPDTIMQSLYEGRPVALMGKGGAFGSGEHYMLADSMNANGDVNVIDPVGGRRFTSSADVLSNHMDTAIYGRGKRRGKRNGRMSRERNRDGSTPESRREQAAAAAEQAQQNDRIEDIITGEQQSLFDDPRIGRILTDGAREWNWHGRIEGTDIMRDSALYKSLYRKFNDRIANARNPQAEIDNIIESAPNDKVDLYRKILNDIVRMNGQTSVSNAVSGSSSDSGGAPSLSDLLGSGVTMLGGIAGLLMSLIPGGDPNVIGNVLKGIAGATVLKVGYGLFKTVKGVYKSVKGVISKGNSIFKKVLGFGGSGSGFTFASPLTALGNFFSGHHMLTDDDDKNDSTGAHQLFEGAWKTGTLAKNAVKNVMEWAGVDFTKNTAKEAAEQAVNSAVKTATKEGVENSVQATIKNTAKYAAKSGVENTVEQLSKSGAEKLAKEATEEVVKTGVKGKLQQMLKSVADTAVPWLQSKIKSFCESKVVSTFLGGKASKALRAMGSKIIAWLPNGIKSAAEKVGKKSLSLLKAIPEAHVKVAVTVAFGIWDFISGFGDAYRYFGVKATDATLGMKIASAVTKTIIGVLGAFGVYGFLLSLIPPGPIAVAIYKVIAGDEARIELEARQKELQEETAKYNEEHGTNLSAEEYAQQQKGPGLLKSIGNAILHPIKTTKSAIKKLEEKKKENEKKRLTEQQKADLAKDPEDRTYAGRLRLYQDAAVVRYDEIDDIVVTKEMVPQAYRKEAHINKVTNKIEYTLTGENYVRFKAGAVAADAARRLTGAAKERDDQKIKDSDRAIKGSTDDIRKANTPTDEKAKAIYKQSVKNGQNARNNPNNHFLNGGGRGRGRRFGRGVGDAVYSAVTGQSTIGEAATSYATNYAQDTVTNVAHSGLSFLTNNIRQGVSASAEAGEALLTTAGANHHQLRRLRRAEQAALAANETLPIAKKLSKFIAEKIDDVAKNPVVKTVFSKLSKSIDKAGKALVRFVDKHAPEWLVNASAKVGITSSSQLTGVLTGGLISIAFGIWDFFQGINNAADYFGVYPEDVTLKMKLCAGLVGFVLGILSGLPYIGIVMAFIPTTPIIKAVYKAISNDKEDARIQKAQDTFKAENYKENLATKIAKAASDTMVNLGSKIVDSKGKGRNGRGGAIYDQTDPRMNRLDPTMADAGCGPTVAAMMADRFGRGNPVEASAMAYAGGYRDADGGTNPEFFSAYGASKGIDMYQGSTAAGAIADSLGQGRPVALMGQGGAFGSGMHYLLADGINSSGNVNLVDPIGGKQISSNINALSSNTSTAIYGQGRGHFGRGKAADHPDLMAEDVQQEREAMLVGGDVPSGKGRKFGRGPTIKNGMVYYNQTDDPWGSCKTGPGGSCTIRQAGCCISSLAMCLSQIAGKEITPDQIGKKYSFTLNGGGMRWNKMTEVAKLFGGEFTELTSAEQIIAAVAAGKPVIIYGEKPKCPVVDYSNGSRSGPHCVVIAQVSADGKTIRVNDPGKRARCDKDIPVSGIKNFKCAYAASKGGAGVSGNAVSASSGSSGSSVLDTVKNFASKVSGIVKKAIGVGLVQNKLTNRFNQIFGIASSDSTTTSSTTGSTTSTSTSSAASSGFDTERKGQTVVLPEGLGSSKTYMAWQMITARGTQQYKLKEDTGMPFDSEGFGKVNNRYVLAMTPKYGKIGDYVDVKMSDDTVIPGILGDFKNTKDKGANEWGHDNGNTVLEFVVDKASWYNKKGNPGTAKNHPEWKGLTVKSVTNQGSYFENGKGRGKGSRASVKPKKNIQKSPVLGTVVNKDKMKMLKSLNNVKPISRSAKAATDGDMTAEELKELKTGILGRGRGRFGRGEDFPKTVNGIPYFAQADPRWGTKAYGYKGTLASSGCGPTSMAMVASAFGLNVTPDVTADWSASHGYRVDGGTSWEFFPKYAESVGLVCENLNNDISRVIDALKQNKVCIASMGPGYFTKHGHFIVLAGINSNGEILTNDPNDRTSIGFMAKSNTPHPPDLISSQSKNFWAFSKGDGTLPSGASAEGGSSAFSGNDAIASGIQKIADNLSNRLNRVLGALTGEKTEDESGSSTSTSSGNIDSASGFADTGGELTKTGSDYLKYTDLTDTDKARLAKIITREQGGGVIGSRQEASQMVNLNEVSKNRSNTAADLRKTVFKSGWYGSDAEIDKLSYTDTAMKAVEEVMVQGKRTLPRYVTEHDMFPKDAALDGTWEDKQQDKTTYKAHETQIKQNPNRFKGGGSTYTFYNFAGGDPNASGNPDVFGYYPRDYEKYKSDTPWGSGRGTQAYRTAKAVNQRLLKSVKDSQKQARIEALAEAAKDTAAMGRGAASSDNKILERMVTLFEQIVPILQNIEQNTAKSSTPVPVGAGMGPEPREQIKHPVPQVTVNPPPSSRLSTLYDVGYPAVDEITRR